MPAKGWNAAMKPGPALAGVPIKKVEKSRRDCLTCTIIVSTPVLNGKR